MRLPVCSPANCFETGTLRPAQQSDNRRDLGVLSLDNRGWGFLRTEGGRLFPAMGCCGFVGAVLPPRGFDLVIFADGAGPATLRLMAFLLVDIGCSSCFTTASAPSRPQAPVSDRHARGAGESGSVSLLRCPRFLVSDTCFLWAGSRARFEQSSDEIGTDRSTIWPPVRSSRCGWHSGFRNGDCM